MEWPYQLFLLLIFLVSVLGTGGNGDSTMAHPNNSPCLVDECGDAYHEAMVEAGIDDPEPSAAFCEIHKTLIKCLDSTKDACSGIHFRMTVSTNHILAQKHCSRTKNTNATTDGSKKGTRQRQNMKLPPPGCKYLGSHKFRQCSFFGDPHLKTFDSRFQTCKIRGTWNLINNPYVQVQVTNDPVLETLPTTAPTKISVLIRGGKSTPCTLEKRYKAEGSSPLPSTFDDGTDRPGADPTVIVERVDSINDTGETVQIFIRYIGSTLLIHRYGQYLAFSAQFPIEVINSSIGYNGDSDELCITGCPAGEQLDLTVAREYSMRKEEALHECKKVENLSKNIRNNLTDHYLDWCVFDLMMVGTAYEFVAGAHAAQLDALKMEPSSLKNRTELLEWLVSNDTMSTGTASMPRAFLLPFYFLVSTCIVLVRVTLGNNVWLQILYLF